MLVHIKPAQSKIRFELQDLWHYRELLTVLTWRDIRVRYKQTIFGACWAVLQPVMMMVVLSLTLGRLPHVQHAAIPYPVFVFSGLVPWTYFARALTGTCTSLADNSSLISKVYFPRLVLPLVPACAGVVDLLATLVLVLGLAAAYGLSPGLGLLALPFLILLLTMLTFSLGLWLASLTVYYRDLRFVIPSLMQVWFFLCPIAYSSELVPKKYALLQSLNPIIGIIEGFRWACTGVGAFPAMALGQTFLWILVLLVGGLMLFRRVEHQIVDVI